MAGNFIYDIVFFLLNSIFFLVQEFSIILIFYFLDAFMRIKYVYFYRDVRDLSSFMLNL